MKSDRSLQLLWLGLTFGTALLIAILATAGRHSAIAITAGILAVMTGALFFLRWNAAIADEIILELLANGGWWTGRELVQFSNRALHPGTIYVHLARLEDQGLIRSRPIAHDDDPPTGLPGDYWYPSRRAYALPPRNHPRIPRKDYA